MRKRLFVICLAAVLIICSAGIIALNNRAAEYPVPEIKGTTFKSSGGELKLSVDKESGIVCVSDSTTGTVWNSNPSEPTEDEYTKAATLNNIKSQLIVTYYDQDNKKAVIGNYIASVKRSTFTVTEKGNKIRVDYDFSRRSEEFKIPVEYSVFGNVFTAEVLVNEIEEYGEARIAEISLLPYFMHGTAKDSGYLFIPDGSGALIDIVKTDASAAAYSQRVYGRDKALEYYYDNGNSEQCFMPVFGINKNSRGVLAVINGNPAAATVNAECIGISSSYSRVWSSFVYRAYDTVTIAGSDWRNKEYTAYSDNTESENFSVNYHFLSDGSYSSMAREYRNEIKESYGLTKLTEEKAVNGALKVYGVTTVKSAFLGVPYTKKIAATDISGLSRILGDLHGETEKSGLAVFLKDFDTDGFKGNSADSLKWYGKAGSGKDYSALEKSFSDRFYQIKNVLYKESDFAFLEQSKFAQMVSKDYIRKTEYSDVTYAAETGNKYALNKDFLNKYMNGFIKKAAKNKSGIGVALDDIGRDLYSDYNLENYNSRNKMTAVNSSLTAKLSESGINTAVQGGNVYNSGTADLLYDIPTAFSDYDTESRSVPFYQMVFHGYVNMVSYCINNTENPKIELLRCIESGTIPCYAVTEMNNSELRRTEYKSLYNTYYGDISDEIKSAFSKYKALSSEIFSSEITEHSEKDGLTVTTYENGVKIAVNYNGSAAEYNGKTIEAFGFELFE